MTAWLDLAPTAFDRNVPAATPVALFGAAEVLGTDGALFDAAGDPVADAVAPGALRAEREALLGRLARLDAERAALLARLDQINGTLSA